MFATLFFSDRSLLVICEQWTDVNWSIFQYIPKILKGYSSSHDQVVLDIRQRCWLIMVKVDESKTSQL